MGFKQFRTAYLITSLICHQLTPSQMESGDDIFKSDGTTNRAHPEVANTPFMNQLKQNTSKTIYEKAREDEIRRHC